MDTEKSDIGVIQDLLLTTKEVAHLFGQKKSEKTQPQFNVFQIMSPKYHYEKFHSDIIFYFLKEDEMHKRGNDYLQLLIAYLNLLNSNVNPEDFKNPVVTKEKLNIDIWIRDETSKQSIIIENKINNASDTRRQLIDYNNYVSAQGYNPTAIFYLSLDGRKRPQFDNYWKEDEIATIESIFTPLAAFNDTEADLCSGWLSKCIENTFDSHVKGTLEQYQHLLKVLSKNIMDNKNLADFYELVKTPENYKTAIEVSDMVKQLPAYLAQKTTEEYNQKGLPFDKIFFYNQEGLNACVLEKYDLGNESFLSVDVNFDLDKILVTIFERNPTAKSENSVIEFLDKLKIGKGFKNLGERYGKTFTFPEEERDFHEFMDDLSEVVKKKTVQ